MTAQEAVRLIPDGATVTTGGFCGAGFAEDLAIHLMENYVKEKHPKDLTLVYCAGQGDFDTKGLSHLGHEGLVKKIIAGHFGGSPKLSKFVIDNKIQAYNFPQGVLSQMFRDTAARKPRTITKVGLHTFVDPRLEGGMVNEMTTEPLVEIVTFDDEEYLAYKTIPLDVAILRGTTADEDGNITMEKEALTLEAQAQAMPKVEESDSMAQAMKYTHDASNIDSTTRANPAPEQTCANCALVQGEDGADWRPCQIFPGKVVAAGGWCSVWAPKA